MGRTLILLCALVLPACSGPRALGPDAMPQAPLVTRESFAEQVTAAKARYEKGMAEHAPLLEDGRLDAFAQALVTLIPLREQTAGDAWVLGEALYRLHPEQSRVAHERASVLAPHLSEVAFAWALQELRAGHHQEACDTFEALTGPAEAGTQDDLYLSGRTRLYQGICLTGLGRHQEAARAYFSARERLGQAPLNFALVGIQTADNPHRDRQRLREALRAGTLSHPGELLVLDLMWPSNPWKLVVNTTALDRDLEAIEEALAPGDPRLAEYGVLVSTHAAETDDEGFASLLREAGLFLDGGRLPRDAFVTSTLLADVLRRGLLTHSAAAVEFADLLRARATAPGGHVEDLRSAVQCVVQSEPTRLAELDAIGWERFRDLGFVVNVLAARSPLAGDDPMLKRARRDFSDEPLLDYLILDAALGAKTPKSAVDPEMLGMLVMAEFRSRAISRHLEESPHGILDGLFKLMEAAEAGAGDATPQQP